MNEPAATEEPAGSPDEKRQVPGVRHEESNPILDGQADEKWREVEEWLRGVGLYQYKDNLKDHGFTTMRSVSFIVEDDLSAMGIDLRGHRRLLLGEAQALRANQGNQAMFVQILARIDELKVSNNELKVSINELKLLTKFDPWSAASTTCDREIMDDLEEAFGGRRCCISGRVLLDDDELASLDSGSESGPPDGWPTYKEIKDVSFVRPSHLFPRTKAAQLVANSLIGPKAGYGEFDLNSSRNVLMMRYDLEHAYDNKYIIIYPVDLSFETYKIAVLHADVDELVKREVCAKFVKRSKTGRTVQGGAERWNSFGLSVLDFDGAGVTLPEMKNAEDVDDEEERVVPYRRVLGLHIELAVTAAQENNWPLPPNSQVDFEHLLTLSNLMSRRGSLAEA